MKKIIYILTALIVSLSFNSAVAADAESAAKLYESGKYKEAVKEYEEIAERDGTSVSLLYNLGNAAVKAEDYGKGVVAYKSALNIDPADADVRANLRYAISKVDDRNRVLLKGKQLNVEKDSGSFFSSLRRAIVSACSPDVWSYMAVGSFILMLGGVALYIFAHGTLPKKIGFFGAIVLLALTIMFNVFAYLGKRDMTDQSECVITSYRVELCSEPIDNAKTVAAPLSAGTLMDVLEKKKDDQGTVWYKVRLNNDYIGWIKAMDVAIV